MAVVNPQYCSLEPLKSRDVFVTEAKFITDSVWEYVLNHFAEGTIVPPDTVLVSCKLYEIVDGLVVTGKRDCYYCILIIILW